MQGKRINQCEERIWRKSEQKRGCKPRRERPILCRSQAAAHRRGEEGNVGEREKRNNQVQRGAKVDGVEGGSIKKGEGRWEVNSVPR